MRLLDRHILRELLGPFLFGVAAFTSLMFAGKELFKLTELIAEFHAPVLTAAKLMVLQMPGLIVITLPMAMLLAALLGFGRLSGDSEVVALFAGGISFYRVAIPVIVMSVMVTVMSFTLNEAIAPKANSSFERIYEDLTKKPTSSVQPFFVIDSSDGVTNSVFYVRGGFDLETNTLRDIDMIRYSSNKPAIFIHAEKAVRKAENAWAFMDGYTQNLGATGNTAVLTFEEGQTREIKINKTPDQLALYQKKHDELSFAQLRDYIVMLQAEGADVNELRVKLYEKIALPLTSLVFALIGAPLGLRPHRSGSAVGLGLAIVIIFAYWILMHYMTILGNNGTVSPVAASFTPTLLGLAVGLGLINRAAK